MDLTAGKVSYEDPRLDAVFDHWRELIDPGYFLEDHASFSWQDAQAPQINGEAAMYLIFMYQLLKQQVLVIKWISSNSLQFIKV